jgi:hypothetical protein
MNFLRRLLRKRCSHQFTWPRIDGDGHYYQRCLLCGTAYEYDWKLMRRTDRVIVADVPLHLALTHGPSNRSRTL